MEKRRLVIYTFTMLFILSVLVVFVINKRRPSVEPGTPFPVIENDVDLANGAAIFTTGKDISGRMIPIGGGPSWIILEGGGCSACHGDDGGGKKEVRDLKLSPSNIVKAVTKGRGMSDEELESLLKWGVTGDGRTLSWEMPRFAIPLSDMKDLKEYIKGL